MSEAIEIKVPDIGTSGNVDVIEVLVKAGDSIEENTPLLTLESDKASMEIPSPFAGTIDKIIAKVGDKVTQGSSILLLKTEAKDASKPRPKPSDEAPKKEALEKTESIETAKTAEASKDSEAPKAVEPKEDIPAPIPASSEGLSQEIVSAGPAVRRFARELGVNLQDVKGSERAGRISKEDVQNYVKTRMTEAPASAGFALPQAATIDFSKFGPIDTKALNKIKRLTAQQVHRSWISVPHVTQFDEADITELEAFRKLENENSKSAAKLTVLAFVLKALTNALKVYPEFNASLDPSGTQLIYKHYYNIGIAVETPQGLVVPVVKQADKLSVSEIALEMARLSQKARDKGIEPMDMSGGSFTISSLGGIGGTAFTPIVNSPEVAILGLSRASIKPLYNGKAFEPRLSLPLSLSYDHRVIDGAEAARFTRYLVDLLSDIRRIIL